MKSCTVTRFIKGGGIFLRGFGAGDEGVAAVALSPATLYGTLESSELIFLGPVGPAVPLLEVVDGPDLKEKVKYEFVRLES